MSVLPAQMIRARCNTPLYCEALIYPFVERGVFEGMSYGLSPCGYDVRLKETLWVWPFFRRLGSTIERFAVPNDLRGTIENKSSWVRKGIDASMSTNLEPGWRGHLTVEIVRHLPWPIRIKAGTPIMQVVFEELVEPTEQPYGGKYQDQPSHPVPALSEPDAPSRERVMTDEEIRATIQDIAEALCKGLPNGRELEQQCRCPPPEAGQQEPGRGTGGTDRGP